eukprot:CAMPEP_0206429274 /NCGR_PEP_ID=MMETSP0324_2-20121206/6140_1 /ASSEMBLY_ACC=CAM_ASM_000836 /TAXON_ID=2866 /ORGANISM="Crypthecodinium cohnii, Strain Seligo" /LENGTH=139 /DNA_ID=CAMNT_0053894917 /DNA_START=399 /DNA_END=814 /DNA_ORIENTATION=-
MLSYSSDVGRCRSTDNQLYFICYASSANDPEEVCEEYCDCLGGTLSCSEETTRGVIPVVVGWINTVFMWTVGFCSFRVWRTSTTLVTKWGILSDVACNGGVGAAIPVATGSLQLPAGTVVVGQPVAAAATNNHAVVGAP